MKRILCALLSALLLLTLTACGGKKPVEDPSVQLPVEQPDTPDTPAPGEAEQSLADLRETIRAAGAVLGCAYLGATYGNDALDLHALLEDNGYAARYPFLLDLPSKLAVSTGGWEIYCIVPADEDVSITVNEFGWPSWDAEGPVAGEVLWESGSGTPLCIAANVSDHARHADHRDRRGRHSRHLPALSQLTGRLSRRPRGRHGVRLHRLPRRLCA